MNYAILVSALALFINGLSFNLAGKTAQSATAALVNFGIAVLLWVVAAGIVLYEIIWGFA